MCTPAPPSILMLPLSFIRPCMGLHVCSLFICSVCIMMSPLSPGSHLHLAVALRSPFLTRQNHVPWWLPLHLFVGMHATIHVYTLSRTEAIWILAYIAIWQFIPCIQGTITVLTVVYIILYFAKNHGIRSFLWNFPELQFPWHAYVYFSHAFRFSQHLEVSVFEGAAPCMGFTCTVLSLDIFWIVFDWKWNKSKWWLSGNRPFMSFIIRVHAFYEESMVFIRGKKMEYSRDLKIVGQIKGYIQIRIWGHALALSLLIPSESNVPGLNYIYP